MFVPRYARDDRVKWTFKEEKLTWTSEIIQLRVSNVQSNQIPFDSTSQNFTIKILNFSNQVQWGVLNVVWNLGSTFGNISSPCHHQYLSELCPNKTQLPFPSRVQRGTETIFEIWRTIKITRLVAITKTSPNYLTKNATAPVIPSVARDWNDILDMKDDQNNLSRCHHKYISELSPTKCNYPCHPERSEGQNMH